ncbi:hypothetical protein D3C71_1706670 [compost metagenome]
MAANNVAINVSTVKETGLTSTISPSQLACCEASASSRNSGVFSVTHLSLIFVRYQAGQAAPYRLGQPIFE